MPSVKRGSPLIRKSILTKFREKINKKLFHLKLFVAGIIHNFEIYKKTLQLLQWLINTMLTGAIIYYIINYQNFFSYGLSVMVFLYYFDIFVQKIKKPYKE